MVVKNSDYSIKQIATNLFLTSLTEVSSKNQFSQLINLLNKKGDYYINSIRRLCTRFHTRFNRGRN